VPYVPPRGAKHWIFQVNPKTFRIFDWWKDHQNDDSITWSIRQYADEVRKGDLGVIWLSGNKSGVYALVKVASDPANIDHTEEEKRYWAKSTEIYKIAKRAALEYQMKLFDRPIERWFCLNDEVLSDMSILRQPQRTVFKLTVDQFDRISEYVQRRA